MIANFTGCVVSRFFPGAMNTTCCFPRQTALIHRWILRVRCLRWCRGAPKAILRSWAFEPTCDSAFHWIARLVEGHFRKFRIYDIYDICLSFSRSLDSRGLSTQKYSSSWGAAGLLKNGYPMLTAVVREHRLGWDADFRLALVPNSCCQCNGRGTF